MSRMKKDAKKRQYSIKKSEQRTAYLCLFPSIIGLVFITYLPLVCVFGVSFFQWKGLSNPKFNGINKYVRLFTKDPYFLDSISVTMIFELI